MMLSIGEKTPTPSWRRRQQWTLLWGNGTNFGNPQKRQLWQDQLAKFICRRARNVVVTVRAPGSGFSYELLHRWKILFLSMECDSAVYRSKRWPPLSAPGATRSQS